MALPPCDGLEDDGDSAENQDRDDEIRNQAAPIEFVPLRDVTEQGPAVHILIRPIPEIQMSVRIKMGLRCPRGDIRQKKQRRRDHHHERSAEMNSVPAALGLIANDQLE